MANSNDRQEGASPVNLMQSPPTAASVVTRASPMRVLIASDTWRPQVNSVVRALEQMIRQAAASGATVELVSALDFRSLPLPNAGGLRLGLCLPREVARRIAAFDPTHIHIATEGPVGLATRWVCMRHGLPFSTSTRGIPEFFRSRVPFAEPWVRGLLHAFHRPAGTVMVATPSLRDELIRQGLQNVRLWSPGVDASMFNPHKRVEPNTARPVFLYAGRLTAESNLPAFLSLKLPGSKVVIGDGPARKRLAKQFPQARFLGSLTGQRLAAAYASADVFVFPSRAHNTGMVLLEALASGLPVAAYPVAGAKDVLGDSGCGVLHQDLRTAALAALNIPSMRCRAYAQRFRWEESARQFFDGVRAANGRHEIDASVLER